MLAQNPIADDELAGLFSSKQTYRLIVLAVSGGADSVALMHLFSKHQTLAADTGPDMKAEVVVATVDHGLRPGSKSEARFVANQAKKLGLEHVVLPWLGDKPASAIQSRARDARYRLLGALANERNLKPAAIILAHHRDDQAETVLMRLARGSGIDGLTGMAIEETTLLNGQTTLWRPLLDVPKSRLIATLERDHIEWIDDPSNENTDFERVRIRKARSQRDTLGLSDTAVSKTARRLERANNALTEIARKTFEQNVQLFDGAYGEIPAHIITNHPEEIVLRVVARTIQHATGSPRPANLSKLEDMVSNLRAAIQAPEKAFARTLSGCVITLEKPTTEDGNSQTTPDLPIIRFFCEPGRADLTELTIKPGQSTTWSRRFTIHLPDSAKTPLTLRPLGSAGLAELRALAPGARSIPPRAIASLPSFWDANRLIFVPHLDYLTQPWSEPLPRVQSAAKSGQDTP